MYAIGVDIGGMSIKVGVVNEKGEIISVNKLKTEKDFNLCVKNIVNQVNQVLTETGLSLNDIQGIGIGCPGAVNAYNGMVEFLPNLGWEKVPLVSELQKYLDTKIVISNDANVAALAEAVYGCAKDYNDVVMFTLGTGVGGGIILNKKLYEGGCKKGAELGHTTLIYGGEKCNCGRSGCVERYVSATALINQTKNAMLEDRTSKMWEYVGGNLDKVDGRTAFECAKLNDSTAIKVRDKYVEYLSESMMNLFNIFRPDAFIIGGGISAQGKYLTDRVKEYCEKYEYGYKCAPKTEILVATLGNDAGIIGAAELINQ